MAVLAVAMLVATGASHDLLHLDEPLHPVQAEVVSVRADHVGAPHAVHPGVDADGCSAHSASAHAAALVATTCVGAPGATLSVAWGLAATAIVHDLSPDIPHDPPRA